jgi:hypothetical protein
MVAIERWIASDDPVTQDSLNHAAPELPRGNGQMPDHSNDSNALLPMVEHGEYT